jgi:hypothetical protein
MKFFNISLGQIPTLKATQRKLLRDREEKIIEDIKRLEQLKKMNTDKISRYDMLQIFRHPANKR